MSIPVQSMQKDYESLNETAYFALLIKQTDPQDTAFTFELTNALTKVLPSSFSVINNNSSTTAGSMTYVLRLLNLIFDIIIAITMFLCLFALSANMSANIFQ